MIDLGIDIGQAAASLGIVLQIFIIDLLLSADNALVIALAVRSLPAEQARLAAWVGTAAAVALRIGMAGLVLVLFDMPYLKLAAATLLLAIALKLSLERADPAAVAALEGAEATTVAGRRRLPWRAWPSGLVGAVCAIIVADAVMSLDNVVAIAALAGGSLLLLTLGLLLSIPMLVYGSAMIRGLIGEDGRLMLLGGMFLGWIAGDIGVSDPSVSGWIESGAPALGIVVPMACAVFVLWENRILRGWTAGKEG